MNDTWETSTIMANKDMDPADDMDIENGFAAVLTFIIMIVGIVGNFLTVAALIKCPKVRNVAAAFIISLCIADLLFCAIVLPFSALRFLQGTWNHGVVLCKIIPFIQYGNIGVSLLCIGMITINRYVMIAHHTAYGRIYKKHWIAVMIAFCWLFSYGMQTPTLFGVWGKFDYDPKLGTCSIMNDAHGNSSKTTLFIIAFVIPCLIIIACYTKIFWVVHKSEVRMQRHANKQNSIPNNLRPVPAPTASGVSTDNGQQQQQRVSTNVPSDGSSYSSDVKHGGTTVVSLQQPKASRIKDQRELRAKRNEWRITKMVLAIFLSFVVCYLPITVAKVADKDVDHPGLQIFSYLMLYLSACINPIIYVIMNKQYRKAYKTVILCETSKLLPFGRAGNGAGGGAGGGGGGGSSAAEKWKDTGLSLNHSRTVVSQMSTADQPNTSLSSSQAPSTPTPTPTPPSQQIDIELRVATPTTTTTNSSSTLNPNSTTTINHQVSGTADPTKTTPTATTNGGWTESLAPLARPSVIAKRDSNQLSSLPVDVILEEEEEDAVTLPTVPANAATAAASHDTLLPNEIVYANVAPPRKIPFYGQNINATPDNANTKLQSKDKI